MNDRHTELSSKIFDMGEALCKEGQGKDDVMISSAGNIMIVISALLYDMEDMKKFNELCEMFSAKKFMDSQMELGPLSNLNEEELLRMIKELRKGLNDEDSEDE